MKPFLRRRLAAALAGVVVAAAPTLAAAAGGADDLVAGDLPSLRPCPAGVGAEVRCLAGRDDAGAYYWIAVPDPWNGVLVLHAHGGPELGAPKLERGAEDLKRWSVFPRAGYAWAGSTFRQGGVAVGAAAEDTERLRGIFIDAFGAPRRTILHGQSWGASVAARGAELYRAAVGSTDRPPYDAVLLTSGVLGGGTKSYDFRLDLRVVWQAVCGNHPREGEPQYPLWQGLPPDSKLGRAELNARIDECTGLSKPPAERSDEQARRLKTILDVVKIPERSLAGHLAWATWHFQDIVARRTGGGNPFGNVGVRYAGSDDDAALNDKAARYAADPAAVKTFGADTDPQGRIPVPVLTVHGIDDPIAFVELESAFHETMRRAGTADHLVQAFTADAEHSYLSDAQYVAAIEALLGWVERGEMPSPKALAERCKALEPRWGGAGCRFVPDYLPAPLASRVPAR